MKKYLLLAVFFFANFIMAGYCQGADLSGLQPPAPYGVFSTMSASSPPRGKAAFALAVERSGEPNFWRFATNLAYGITNSVEFSASIPYVDNSDSGLEDIAFGVKHRFFDEGKYGPSIAYLFTFSVASGVSERSTGGRAGGGIIVSKRVGPVNGHLNLFYALPFDSALKDELRFSAGIDFSASHDFQILGELYGRSSHFSDELDELEARFGYRFAIRELTFTTIGVGFDIKDRSPEYRIIASLTWIFPREKKTINRIYE